MKTTGNLIQQLKATVEAVTEQRTLHEHNIKLLDEGLVNAATAFQEISEMTEPDDDDEDVVENEDREEDDDERDDDDLREAIFKQLTESDKPLSARQMFNNLREAEFESDLDDSALIRKINDMMSEMDGVETAGSGVAKRYFLPKH